MNLPTLHPGQIHAMQTAPHTGVWSICEGTQAEDAAAMGFEVRAMTIDECLASTRGKPMKDMSNEQIDAAVAQALGYRAYLNQRGDYRLAVVQAPGAREPWKSSRNSETEKPRYTEVTCAEAQKAGFFGNGFPAYSTDATAALAVVEAMYARGRGFSVYRVAVDGCKYIASFGTRTSAESESFPRAVSLAALAALAEGASK